MIDFEKNKLFLHKDIPVCVSDTTTILPHSEAILKGTLTNKICYPNGFQGECSPFKALAAHQHLLTAHSAVTVRDNSVPVKLMNFTSKAIKLRKGQIIASCNS